MFIEDLILSAADIWLRRRTRHNRRLTRYFQRHCGRVPNAAYPQRYSELMFWRKLVDRNPDFVMFTDKLATKEFIRRRCPELAVPKTLWVGSCADDIPDELLQRDVYVKTNHGCSWNFRTRGRPVDRAALRESTDKWLNSIYGESSYEWSYAKVRPKLFVEEPVGDAETDLLEIWARTSNGLLIQGSVVSRCKLPGKEVYYLDAAGVPVRGMPQLAEDPIRPLPPEWNALEPYVRAVNFARRLSVGTDYARYDFFWNGKELYAGEITVFPAMGTLDSRTPEIDRHYVAGWDLRDSHFLKTRQKGLMGVYAWALRRRLQRDRPGWKPNPLP